jgi:hypothetical protein
VKPTTAIALIPLFLLPLLGTRALLRGESWKRRVPLLLPIAIGVVSAGAWTAFADRIKAASPFTADLTSSALVKWNFGFPTQRFLPDQFLAYFENLAAIAGPLLLLVAVTGVAFILNPRKIEVAAFALPPLVAFFVFTNVFVVHAYYVAAVMVSVVAVSAITIASLSRISSDRFAQWATAATAIVIIVGGAWTSREGLKAQSFYYIVPERALAAEIRSNTPIGSGIILVGCGWDPQTLYAADRHGLMIGPGDKRSIPGEWIPSELQYIGYCSEEHGAVSLPEGVRRIAVSSHLELLQR